MDIQNHLGVYGVNIVDSKLLCIKKNAGPYKGRFDLPGGSQNVGEGLTETLVREILEETGFTVKNYCKPRVYDVFVHEEKMDFMVHHIMIFYDVEIDANISQYKLPFLVEDGLNDSDDAVWIDLAMVNLENASPLVLKVKEEWLQKAELDKQIYDDWKVK